MAAQPETGFVPIPDPTKLTTDAVNAAEGRIKELFDTKLEGFRHLVAEQFEGRDKALASALVQAKELVKQQNDSNQLAIDKSEKSFATLIGECDKRITELKNTVNRMEAKNWATVGAYIVGALGVASVVIAALIAALEFHR